jgi:spermidine/putrescine-binding protein
MSKNKDFQFVVPSDGYTLAIDNFAIPRTARNKAEAHELIIFF